MKKIIVSIITLSSMLFMYSCSSNSCKDVLALNIGIDDDCRYSKVAFYITSGSYTSRTTFESYSVTKSEVSVNGRSIGLISKIGRPNNCSTVGSAFYQFKDGGSIDWSNVVTLSNGSTITYTGTVEPSPNNPCITVIAD